MKISHQWLSDFLQFETTVAQCAEILTDLGLEVEGTTTYTSIPGNLEGIVVGEVVACSQHPNADRLKTTKVDIGTGDPLPIVCGAPNVAQGQKVLVATVGTTLYPTGGESFKINKSKIRGEVSQGMICAEDEIGIGTDHSGIVVLDAKHKVGTPAAEIYEVVTDTVYEIGLTPNRADAMSHMGVARDLKAACMHQELPFTWSKSEFSIPNSSNEERIIKVDVKAPEKAPYYYGITLSNLKVKASPAWMQHRLKAIGIQPKNNIVDITNYVLHAYGQPLHAFDANTLKGDVIVQTLPEGTAFTTLDGVERKLSAEDLMICDQQQPHCIAGVFGGLHSGVTEKTNAVFLESAYFDPVSIRKTAKRHGLNTDASFRFERGIDPEIGRTALAYAVELILEYAGGECSSEIQEVCAAPKEAVELFLQYEYIKKTLGLEIPLENLNTILSALDIEVKQVTDTGLALKIPTYRVDVTRPADVVEEILRVYGYNAVPLPEHTKMQLPEFQAVTPGSIRQGLANQLVHKGFFEVKNNSLTRPGYQALSKDLSSRPAVALLNPLGQELSVLRSSLLFGLLENIQYNANRQQKHLKFFEFGTVYEKTAKGYKESPKLGIVVMGTPFKEHWQTGGQDHPYYFLKGVLENLLVQLGINTNAPTSDVPDYLAEGLTVTSGKQPLAYLGLPAPKIVTAFGIEQALCYAEFDLNHPAFKPNNTHKTVSPIPKFPQSQRDFSLLLDTTVTFEDIKLLAQQTLKKQLVEVALFDVYTGKNLPKGKKSYAVRFVFQDPNKTLTDKAVDKAMEKLQQRLEKELGAQLR